MLSEFTHVLISDLDEGGDFVNSCSEYLDFTLDRYEVCMQEIQITVGAWDNVRVSANAIGIDTTASNPHPPSILVEPGAYTTLAQLIEAINKSLKDDQHVYWIKSIAEGPEKERVGIWPYMGYGGFFTKEGEFQIDRQKHGHASETQLRFCKKLAFLLWLIPNINIPVPLFSVGDKIDKSKADVYRNTLSLFWVVADFIEHTIVGPYTYPILRMVPIQLHTGQLKH